MICKYCGSDIGFYTKLKGVQYYDENAEPQGFDTYTQGNSVYCQNCDKRVCRVLDFLRQEKGGNDVKCKECEYLMFSDCYGECRKGYKGIVNPDDSCGKGKRKGGVEE